MTQLTNFAEGDVLTITLESGESFEELVVSYKDYVPAVDKYDKSSVTLDVEGPGIWEQVKDRVDVEVLEIFQSSTRNERSWQDIQMHGTVWVGEDEYTKEPEFKKLGTVRTIEKIEK